MVGCFNISLFSYFDIHRIFDLVSFRMWDFVLWWFDLDFLIFDFNFDFILCISFLFIFLIHFFLKLLFSFLVNYVILNFNINILNYPIFLILILLNFISFLFNVCLTLCLHTIELFNFLNFVCFQDFSGFFETLNLHSKIFKRFNTFSFYIYLLFYYVLSILNNLTVIALRFFFSYAYESYLHTDYNINNKSIDIKLKSLLMLWISHGNNIKTFFLSTYYYVYQLNINFLVTFLLVLVFYEFTTFYVTNKFTNSWAFIKSSKNLVYLHIKFTISNTKSLDSNITAIHLFTYIIFLINYFGIFIKDFNYINFILSFYLVLYIFTYYCLNFNHILFKWFKKQLNFLSSF